MEDRISMRKRAAAGLRAHTRTPFHTLCTHKHTVTHTHTHKHTHARTHTHTHTHTDTCTHTYTHTSAHTHTHTQALPYLCVDAQLCPDTEEVLAAHSLGLPAALQAADHLAAAATAAASAGAAAPAAEEGAGAAAISSGAEYGECAEEDEACQLRQVRGDAAPAPWRQACCASVNLLRTLATPCSARSLHTRPALPDQGELLKCVTAAEKEATPAAMHACSAALIDTSIGNGHYKHATAVGHDLTL